MGLCAVAGRLVPQKLTVAANIENHSTEVRCQAEPGRQVAFPLKGTQVGFTEGSEEVFAM